MKRIARTQQGDFRLRLPARERAVLRALPEELRRVLAAGDPSAFRLFPPAYADDPAANEEYAGMMRAELEAGKIEALSVLEETAGATRLDEEELQAWVGALNDLRLVLGTRLDVTETTYSSWPRADDPRAPELALFGYLTWLQEQAVEALAASLPPPPAG